MIPESKLRALRERLEADGSVRFQNGSLVEYEDCTFCDGRGQKITEIHGETYERDCAACGTEGVRLLVTRPHGGRSRFRLDDAEMRRAYSMALNGPAPKPGAAEQAARAADRFGDVPF
jgi:hypothetical protein